MQCRVFREIMARHFSDFLRLWRSENDTAHQVLFRVLFEAILEASLVRFACIGDEAGCAR